MGSHLKSTSRYDAPAIEYAGISRQKNQTCKLVIPKNIVILKLVLCKQNFRS